MSGDPHRPNDGGEDDAADAGSVETASSATTGDDGRSFWLRVAGRATVAVAVVAVILIAAAIAPGFVLSDRQPAEGPTHAEWQPDALAAEKLDAQGLAKPTGNVGTVVFDQLHGNRFAPEDVESLTSAITRAGGDVEFTNTVGDFASVLDDADVLVVVDPAEPYTEEEVDAVEEFVDDGGRVVIFGEPNRKGTQSNGVSTAVSVERSRLTTLASSFGVTFGSEYVYDMRRNDGSFKSPIVTPPERADHEIVDGVDEVAFYTPTTVTARRGTVLLRTSPTAEAGTRDAKRGFAVAAVTADGDVLAVGDATFLGNGVSSVGDNDVLIARIVEFMGGA